MTNPLQGPDEETPPTFADMISQLEMCTHMNVTSTNPNDSQQWHARRNKARLALSAKLDSLESALREAQKDAKRIDWLNEQGRVSVRNGPDGSPWIALKDDATSAVSGWTAAAPRRDGHSPSHRRRPCRCRRYDMRRAVRAMRHGWINGHPVARIITLCAVGLVLVVAAFSMALPHGLPLYINVPVYGSIALWQISSVAYMPTRNPLRRWADTGEST